MDFLTALVTDPILLAFGLLCWVTFRYLLIPMAEELDEAGY